MNKKQGIGIGIVVVCAIITVGMFTGCLEEETATPAVTLTATLTSTPFPSPTPPLKTDLEKEAVEKTPWMKVVFHDPSFAFQFQRTIGYSYYDGADYEECLCTASRIKEGDCESWYEEWLKTADRVCEIADKCLAEGHNVSAREAYLRASNYYRTAEFYLAYRDPNDPSILETWRKSRECFIKAAPLFSPPFEVVEIPYEGTTLPGYFFRVDDSGTPRPTLILQTGFDGTAEELYFLGGCAAAVRRGYNCLAFEGPGQGRVIREQKLHFRPDWENVVTPVVDYALTRPEIDPDRIALMGVSLGGYLAPRAAAYEHRITACIANGGVFDPFEGAVYPESPEAIKEYIIRDPSSFDAEMREKAKSNTGLQWTMEQGMWTFGAASPSEWMLKFANYTMKGRADKITCPTLVCDGEGDLDYPGQAKKLYDALTCPKEYMLFTFEECAEQHCQLGAVALSDQRIFDWLDKTFARIAGEQS